MDTIQGLSQQCMDFPWGVDEQIDQIRIAAKSGEINPKIEGVTERNIIVESSSPPQLSSKNSPILPK